MSAEIPVITVDGPGGAGKGELCLRLSRKYGFAILDSGAIYRVLAYAALKKNVSLADEPALAALAADLRLSFEPRDTGVAVMLDGEDVSRGIRNEETGGAASRIAALPGVRAALLDRQKAFRTLPGLIADGRDMGTVVFPDAPVKIFLDASSEERARRRVKQLESQGKAADYEKILAEIKERDFRDRNRATAPLKPAPDALILDSTELSIEEARKTPLSYTCERMDKYCTHEFDCFLVKLQTDRSHSIYGFLTKPKDGGKHPVVMCPPGAGIKTIKEPMRNTFYAKNGFIRLEIDIHGLNPALSEDTFKDISNAFNYRENGYLENGLDNRDNYYMKHVYAACVRAIDFLTSLPEWDGKNVAVQGGSQGGALALITAGLDPRVTLCVANHPALSDMAGYLDNRAGGYPAIL